MRRSTTPPLFCRRQVYFLHSTIGAEALCLYSPSFTKRLQLHLDSSHDSSGSTPACIVREARFRFGDSGPQRNELLWTKLISEHTKRGQGGEALRIYKEMLQDGLMPSAYTFVAVLKACSIITDLHSGKEIHARVIQSGNQSNVFVANTLLDMYAKCGSMADARQVFEQMPHRTVASWTAMVMGYAQMQMGDLALLLYERMQHEGFTPNDRTFVAALKACGSLAPREEAKSDAEFLKIECLEKGRHIHSQIAKSGFEFNLFVANTLLHMYAKCGSMVAASRVFELMPHRDVVSWNAMIMGYVQMEMGDSALQLYARMEYEGFTPNDRTFVAALKACGSLAAHEEPKEDDGEFIKLRCLEKGRAIHSQVAKSGFDSNIFVANTMVDMYVKCGSMVNASKVFEKIPHRDVVSWTAMIIGYAQMGMESLALQLYARMQHEGFTPNDRTFVAALKACGSLAAHKDAKVGGELVKMWCLEKGRAIHSQVAQSAFESDLFVATGLVAMYVKCGSMFDARQVFEKMPQRNVVSWTAMIIGYAQMEMGDLALHLYARMQLEGFTPNDRTFVAALKACGSLATHEAKEVDGHLIKIRSLEKGRAIHSQIAKSEFEFNIYVANTLLDMYVKCGSMVDAVQVFEKMRHRDVVSWTVMIIGYAQMEMGTLALQLYIRMQHEGFAPDERTFVAALKACCSLAADEEAKKVDGVFVKITSLEQGRIIHSQIANSGFERNIIVANTLVDMYVKCGSMVDASQVFERMMHRTVVSWSAMLIGYAQMGMGNSALELYARMQHEGFMPNTYTFVAALKACGCLASLEIGRKIHADISKAGLEDDAFIVTCLVDMYGKCGGIVDAQRLFDAFPVRNVVTWNALIAGYSSQGGSECVFYLFERMQQENIQPDGITFVSVLSVCSHTGLVNKGQKYFQAMCSDYGIIPRGEHYSCMVDLLGRANQLDEAVALAKKMPFEPVILTWLTILGACQKQNNVDIGRHAFECAVRLDKKCAAAYVLMMNLCVCPYVGRVC